MRAPRPIAAICAALSLSLAMPLATPGALAAEGDFAAGSKAKSWNLAGEEKARFEAKVVDLLCELTGDCPQDCGAGRRLLGLLRSADNALVMVNKNGQPIFTGPGEDLLPYCNQMVEVDGLLAGDPDEVPVKVYQVQLIRRVGEDEWRKTNRWTRVWRRENPEAARQKGPWFRKDPRIVDRIARDGYLGLGLEKDAAFIEYLFE